MKANNLRSRVLYWDYYSKMSKIHNIDSKLIEDICLSSFKYIKTTMENEDDLKPIMLAYLGKFKLKNKHKDSKYDT